MASHSAMAAMPTGETMAAIDVMEVTMYPKAHLGYALAKAFRNVFITNRMCSPTATVTVVEKAKRLRQLDDDVGWMLSDEVKLSRSTSPQQRTGIQKTFDIVLGPDSHLPDDAKSSLLALKQKWDGDNWGEDTDEEDDNHNDFGIDSVVTVEVRPPPRDHPVYGEGGIMHGVLLVRGNKGQIVYKLNPRVPHRSARVFGHNGIDVGSWWPLQIVALHHGAHGARVAGIAGDSRVGAWSIVVSATYNDLDQDEGDILYYSGSNSHDNEDPVRPPQATNCTKMLKASLLQPRHDIRVLRSGGSSTSTVNEKSYYAPQAGLRYDGLYEVVDVIRAFNRKGGVHEQFKLVRKSGQTPWQQLRRIPTVEQMRDLGKIQDGY